jgi:4-hydroxy-tetrahydrodipicolinate reductase
MTKVAVSGAMGRLGSVIARAISTADDMQLSGAYAPTHAGEVVAGVEVVDSIKDINAQVVVECTHPNVVMENLRNWHDKGVRVVVGTSGFTKERIQEVRSFWGENDPGCLIVPNFSIGAALMMRFAEIASAYFESAEIIERHENTKPDAPSGTALATAMRMAKYRKEAEEIKNEEIVKGARGGLVSGIRVHSLRMRGLLSDQEVAFSNLGETFSIQHRSTSYESFANGALIAIRYVQTIKGVATGLDAALDFAAKHNISQHGT